MNAITASPIRLFVNPKARDGAVETLRDAARRSLGDRADVIETTSPAESRQAIHQACEEGCVVVAAGGDGTVHSVVNAMLACGATCPLGVVPMGTSNNFCRNLGAPLELDLALDALRDGVPKPIDLIRVTADKHPFYCATIATAGNADRVIDALDDADKQRWGAWCYLRAALPVMADLRGHEVRIAIDDGAAETTRLWNVIVANGRYAGGGLEVAPRASMSDGLLDVVLIAEGAGVDLAALASGFLLGDYLQHERVTFRQARRVEIEAPEELCFLADGEPVTAREFRFEAAPGALSVMTPASSSA